MMSSEGEATPIRILVADDHPLMREGITSVIQGAADMVVVAEASNGSEAVDLFTAHRPDVTVMDLQMPKLDGAAAAVAIRGQSPEAKVLILTTYRGDAHVLRALKAGAVGYLLKSMVRTELLEAIRVVHAGQRYIPREVASALAQHVTADALSDRELAVLQQVAAGSSNKRVASDLNLSEETVKSHMKNIMVKLAANDRTHAVTIALSRGLITLPSAT